MEHKRYVAINTSIDSDGLGVPVVSIYFSYCDKKDVTGSFCKECFNPESQCDGIGYELSFDEIIHIVNEKLQSMDNLLCLTTGICFLGGEAICDKNRGMTLRLSKYYKSRFQILYTWRTAELINADWIKNINKIVCGEYVSELNMDDKYILGSTNQYIINNKKETILKYMEKIQ